MPDRELEALAPYLEPFPLALGELDRAPGHELIMTQELVASVLGVRRESVTEAVGKLAQRGFIRFRRGHLTVVDRRGLQTRACECYGVVKKELGRLLHDAQYRQEEPAPG